MSYKYILFTHLDNLGKHKQFQNNTSIHTYNKDNSVLSLLKYILLKNKITLISPNSYISPPIVCKDKYDFQCSKS